MAVPTSLPGLTLLKPLKGCDAETKNCLRSWFLQKYPGPVQILLGVASADDPVCAVVRELLAEFPDADARLVLCGENLGANAKVSTLRQLEPHIRHPLVMISDADVSVSPDFAANIAPLLRPLPASALSIVFIAWPIPPPPPCNGKRCHQRGFLDPVLQSRSLKPVISRWAPS